MRLIDMTSRTFGRLTVIERAGSAPNGRVRWKCRCECGNTRLVPANNLQSGNTTSCGCWNRENAINKATTHGLSNTTEYYVWCSMIQRCEDPNCKSYPNYGGRGISVCERWRTHFPLFLADLGRRPTPWHTLERRDNDADYEPNNCCWATRNEQNNNQRKTLLLCWRGQRHTIREWSDKIPMSYHALRHRIQQGWSVHRALTQPVRFRPSN